jgi:poly-gamma-glutamate synthesis protein (capsule biosynthesis protein)
MSNKPSKTRRPVKKLIRTFLLIFLLMTLSACSSHTSPQSSIDASPTPEPAPEAFLQDRDISGDISDKKENSPDDAAPASKTTAADQPYVILNPEGSKLESRIQPPGGYERLPAEDGELAFFLRQMEVKAHGSPVLLYDGTEKGYQEGHVAVFTMDTGDRDLQQCADSIIRVYAEYYWSLGAYDKIAFHLTNGFLMEYSKWREGNRIQVDGNHVSWKKTKGYDDSYETFRAYLDMVFAYAGTLSLSQECKPITVDEIKPGDLFLQGGSPGHCVLVVDMAQDAAGRRCYLLAQGYMPAQDFHVLKNPLHEEDPWYYEEELTFPLTTPSWTFEEGSLARWADFPLASADGFSANAPSRDPGDSVAGSVGAAGGKSKDTHTDALPALSHNNTSSGEGSQLTLLAVGDNLIHIEVVKSGKQKDGSYRYDHLYDNVLEEIQAADLAVVNQETILGGDDFPYSGYPSFNSPYEIGEALVKAGFDVITHATNHTMDMGYKAVKNTLDFWSRYPEITVLGINRTKEDQEIIPIIEKNGIKLAMLNYTYGLNGYRMPEDKPYLVNLLDKKQMEQDIKKARELADFVIVFPHWGTEYVYEATSMQKDLTAFFYELGVDLVIGTHPHVLEPVEWIGEEGDHKMLVYYSLGNFMSYQKEAPRMLGGMAKVTIRKDDQGTYISDASITPIVTHYEHGPADYNFNIYKLTDYTPELAAIHGVSDIAVRGPLTYEGIYSLAKKVLGAWFEE